MGSISKIFRIAPPLTIEAADQHSDVDFIVATDREVSDDIVQSLQAMHARIYDLESEWAKHLEGSYFPKEILARCDKRGTKLWFLDHGQRSLIKSTHCNTAVVRWVVRERGIRLAGANPAALVDPVPRTVLREEILATMLE